VPSSVSPPSSRIGISRLTSLRKSGETTVPAWRHLRAVARDTQGTLDVPRLIEYRHIQVSNHEHCAAWAYQELSCGSLNSTDRQHHTSSARGYARGNGSASSSIRCRFRTNTCSAIRSNHAIATTVGSIAFASRFASAAFADVVSSCASTTLT